jgi:hypothetical protein
MHGSNSPRDGEARPRDGRHLSEDELNQFIDGELGSAERLQAADHLAWCEQCRSVLTDLQLLADTLRTLPLVDPPRSFRLDPNRAAATGSIWNRWGAQLLPLLPAMRAATIAIALALGGVTAYRVVDNQPSSEQSREQVSNTALQAPTDVIALQPTIAAERTSTQTAAPVNTSRKTGEESGNSADAAAGAPAESAPYEPPPGEDTSADEESDASTQLQPPADGQPVEGNDRSGDAASDEAAPMIAMEAAASPAASPTPPLSPTVTATATVLPSATPAPNTGATPVTEAPADDEERT